MIAGVVGEGILVVPQRPGALVAVGNTSRVLRWGPRHVIKVLDPVTPPHWAALEAEWTSMLHAAGLPVPEVSGIVGIDGRPGIVFEHVAGPTMLEHLLTGSAAAAGRELALLQRWLHQLTPPPDMPRLHERLVRKMHEAPQLTEPARLAALEALAGLVDGDRLCHGDLHPGNIIVSEHGPVILDWFDVAIGHAYADVVRTSILIRPRVRTAPPHYLPGSTNPVLDELHRAYLQTYLEDADATPEGLAAWELPVAAARLCEPGDHSDLEAWLATVDPLERSRPNTAPDVTAATLTGDRPGRRPSVATSR